MDFDETGLYKGFVKNVKGQKYPGRNPTVVSLQEVDIVFTLCHMDNTIC